MDWCPGEDPFSACHMTEVWPRPPLCMEEMFAQDNKKRIRRKSGWFITTNSPRTSSEWRNKHSLRSLVTSWYHLIKMLPFLYSAILGIILTTHKPFRVCTHTVAHALQDASTGAAFCTAECFFEHALCDFHTSWSAYFASAPAATVHFQQVGSVKCFFRTKMLNVLLTPPCPPWVSTFTPPAYVRDFHCKIFQHLALSASSTSYHCK